MYRIRSLKHKIKSCRYVSFDMFDTLIKRNIDSPSDLFDIIERQYNKSSKIKIKDFKRQRIEAARKACIRTGNRDPNLEDVYDELEMSQDQRNTLLNLEIEWEEKICQQNIDFYPVYKYANDRADKILITTDMYLPKHTIETILKKAQIKYDMLLISGVENSSKGERTIFPLIKKKLGAKSSEIIHIGDSKRADYLYPKLYGFKSVLIPRKINKLEYYREYAPATLDMNVVLSFINNNLLEQGEQAYKIGYEVLGIILFGFSKWLIANIKKQGIRKIYFLAREGMILKKAFDLVNDEKAIESRYLYISRKAMSPVLIKNFSSLGDIFKATKMRERVADIDTLFSNLGLDPESYEEQLSSLGLNGKGNIKVNNAKVEKLLHEIREDIVNQARKNEDVLLDYLKQEGFEGKIAVVDIGWGGTMQHALETVGKERGIALDISGYYIGLLKSYADEHSEEKKFGYLYNKCEDGVKLRSMVGMIENMFLAMHGTTIGYERKNEKIEPRLAPYEHSEKEKEFFETMQRGALELVEQLKSLDKLDLEIDGEAARFGLEKLIINPSLKDVNAFGKVESLDTKTYKMADPRSIFYYALHPKAFIKDFNDSVWKIGFMKKMFRLRLNYLSLYVLLGGGGKERVKTELRDNVDKGKK